MAAPGHMLVEHDRGQLKNFVRSCLLLLLKEHPAHGYDLIDRLKSLNVPDGDPGGVYRTLHAMEREGLLTSQWMTSDNGPPRRVYEPTAVGERALERWALSLQEVSQEIDQYLSRWERAAGRALPPCSKTSLNGV